MKLFLITYTQGGGSTRDEMCVAFLAYYPEVGAVFCGSAPAVPDTFVPFASQHIT